MKFKRLVIDLLTGILMFFDNTVTIAVTKMKNLKPNSLINIIIAVSIASLCISLVSIMTYYTLLSFENNKIKEVQSIMSGEKMAVRDEQNSDQQQAKTVEQMFFENFNSLKEQNSDMVGWIEIPKTTINYPVMQTKDDPEFYIRRNFEKEYSFSGTPFADAAADIDGEGGNIVVYAHNMKNNTMFSVLENYLNHSFWEQNKIINFSTSETKMQYEVFSSFIIDTDIRNPEALVAYQSLNDAAPIEVDEYLEFLKQKSLYQPETAPDIGDSFLTLSTCTNEQETDRIVVVAKRIEN